MNDIYAEPPDSYTPTLADLAAALGLLAGAITFIAYRRWRWTS